MERFEQRLTSALEGINSLSAPDTLRSATLSNASKEHKVRVARRGGAALLAAAASVSAVLVGNSVLTDHSVSVNVASESPVTGTISELTVTAVNAAAPLKLSISSVPAGWIRVTGKNLPGHDLSIRDINGDLGYSLNPERPTTTVFLKNGTYVIKSKIPGHVEVKAVLRVTGENPEPVMSVPTGGEPNSEFGLKTNPLYGSFRLHDGRDYDGECGEPVFAARDGVVRSAKYSGGYGKTVQIEHGNGIGTRYAHLSAFSVRPGDRVKAGDAIGEIGNTGAVTGCHLHFEVQVDGQSVDPRQFL